MQRAFLSVAIAAAALAGPAASAEISSSRVKSWLFAEQTSALDNRRALLAITRSSDRTPGPMGTLERAELTAGCSGEPGGLAVFVKWPTYVGNRRGEARATFRIDGGPIESQTWTISQSGMSSGLYGGRQVWRLLGSLAEAQSFVVRVEDLGGGPREASFALDGFKELAAQLAEACA